MTTKLTSNYPGYSANDIPTNQKYITLRTAQDDPMSWAEFDNNFELLRYTVNSLVDDIAVVREDVDYGAEIAVINETIQANYTALDTKFNDYLTIAVADTTYLKKSDEIDAYTKTEVDTNFAAKNDLNDYALASSLDNFALASSLDDFALASTINDVVFSAALDDYYTKSDSDARYQPIGTGSSTFANDNDGWKIMPEYVAVTPAGGPLENTSQALIEDQATQNVAILRTAVASALNKSNPFDPVQRASGVIRLPAGRIYLNERIDIVFPATLGHEFTNSITIKGEGQGVTQLVWTNNSSSQGLFVDIGPYGAIMNQKVNISDMDFIVGNQGMTEAEPYGIGIPTNQEQGALGAKGIGIEITGDRTELGDDGQHAQLTGYSKLQGQGRDPSLSVHYCTFKGWHFSYAGWEKGILIEDVQIVDIVGCSFDTCMGEVDQDGNLVMVTNDDGNLVPSSTWNKSVAGIHLTGDAKCTDFYINQCRFFGHEYGILCNGNIEGVTIQCSTWVNTHYGIWWDVQNMVGGQPYFDTNTNTIIGSVDGTATDAVAQWPLLVVTDCHINCIKKNIYINNGWQIMIKGCSFYGVDINASYGVDDGYGFDASHCSVYVNHKSSNVVIYGNVFSDNTSSTNVNYGALGPSIEIDGHFCVVGGNTFNRDGNRDEPHIKLTARASGNTIQNNAVITPVTQSWADGGVPISVIPANQMVLHVEDNNTGTYNGVSIHTNRKLNNS